VTHDPERLLSGASDADPLERELLASLRDERAPASVRQGAWQGIAAALLTVAPGSAAATGAAVSASSSASSAAGASAAASGTAAGAAAPGSLLPAAAAGGKLAGTFGTKLAAVLVTKWMLVGVVSAAAVGGAIFVSHRQHAARNPAPLVAAAATRPEPRSAPAIVTAPPRSVGIAPAASPVSTAARNSAKPLRVNALAAESALLQSARAELRAGNLAAASDRLQLLRRRFPNGVLIQERDVLQIELSTARGDEAAARRLAARFLRAYPESPHAAQLRQLTAAP
jgi:hypothetical protein